MTTLRPLLAVVIGGAAGSAVRWGLLEVAGSAATPWVTLAINAAGSALLGAVLGLRDHLPARSVLALAPGFTGGLTTFSGYAVAVARSLDDGELLAAVGNGFGTPAAALVAAGIGYRLSRVGASAVLGRRPGRSRTSRHTKRPRGHR